jgi:hypothetical protein
MPPEPVLLPWVQSEDGVAVADFRNKGLGDTLLTIAVSNISETINTDAESRVLDISGNRLTANGVANIVAALEENDEIEIDELDVGHNKRIGMGGSTWLPGLCSYMGHSLSLRRLNLQSTRLTDANVQQFCAALEEHGSALTALNLSDNLLTSVGAAALGTSLQSSAALLTLGELSIGWNAIGAVGAMSLWRALGLNGSRLHSLLMPWNSLGSGRPEFVRPVQTDRVSERGRGRGSAVPTSASVSCEAAVEVLAKVLKTNTELTHLDISFNRIRANECRILAKALETNHTVIGLHVEGNACIIDAEGFLHPLPPPALRADATTEAFEFARKKLPQQPPRLAAAPPLTVAAAQLAEKKKAKEAKKEARKEAKKAARGKGSAKSKPTPVPQKGKGKGMGKAALKRAALEEEERQKQAEQALQSRWAEQLHGRAGTRAAGVRMGLGHINLVESGKCNEWSLADNECSLAEGPPHVSMGEEQEEQEEVQVGEEVQDAATKSRQAISDTEVHPVPRRHQQCMLEVLTCAGLAGSDVGSASDPYVTVHWNGKELCRSSVVSNCNDPSFDGVRAEFGIGEAGERATGMLQVLVFDYDALSEHDKLGTLTLSRGRILTMAAAGGGGHLAEEGWWEHTLGLLTPSKTTNIAETTMLGSRQASSRRLAGAETEAHSRITIRLKVHDVWQGYDEQKYTRILWGALAPSPLSAAPEMTGGVASRAKVAESEEKEPGPRQYTAEGCASACWVCGGWQELKFVFRPVSDGVDAEEHRELVRQSRVPEELAFGITPVLLDAALKIQTRFRGRQARKFAVTRKSVVTIHTSADGFRAHAMDYTRAGTWVRWRSLPRRPFVFYFSVDGRKMASKRCPPPATSIGIGSSAREEHDDHGQQAWCVQSTLPDGTQSHYLRGHWRLGKGPGRRHWDRQTWDDGNGGDNEEEEVVMGHSASRMGGGRARDRSGQGGTLGQQSGDPGRYSGRLVGGTRPRTALGGSAHAVAGRMRDELYFSREWPSTTSNSGGAGAVNERGALEIRRRAEQDQLVGRYQQAVVAAEAALDDELGRLRSTYKITKRHLASGKQLGVWLHRSSLRDLRVSLDRWLAARDAAVVATEVDAAKSTAHQVSEVSSAVATKKKASAKSAPKAARKGSMAAQQRQQREEPMQQQQQHVQSQQKLFAEEMASRLESAEFTAEWSFYEAGEVAKHEGNERCARLAGAAQRALLTLLSTPLAEPARFEAIGLVDIGNGGSVAEVAAGEQTILERARQERQPPKMVNEVRLADLWTCEGLSDDWTGEGLDHEHGDSSEEEQEEEQDMEFKEEVELWESTADTDAEVAVLRRLVVKGQVDGEGGIDDTDAASIAQAINDAQQKAKQRKENRARGLHTLARSSGSGTKTSAGTNTCTAARLFPHAPPRTAGIVAPVVEKKERWTPESSVFAPRLTKAESRSLYENKRVEVGATFRADWGRLLQKPAVMKLLQPKAGGAFGSNDGLRGVRAVLESQHILTSKVFDFYAAESAGGEGVPFAIKNNCFLQFLRDFGIIGDEEGKQRSSSALAAAAAKAEAGEGDVVPGGGCTLDVCQVIFTASKNSAGITGQEVKLMRDLGGTRHLLFRFEFIECLLRIALAKYLCPPNVVGAANEEVDAAAKALKAKKCKGNQEALVLAEERVAALVTDPAQAVKLLVEYRLKPGLIRGLAGGDPTANTDPNTFRRERLYRQEVDLVYEQRLQQLRRVYKLATPSRLMRAHGVQPHNKLRMGIHAWVEFTEDIGLLGSSERAKPFVDLTRMKAKLIFNFAKMRVSDEVARADKWRMFEFTDFLEALGRLAETKDLPTDVEIAAFGCTDTVEFFGKAADKQIDIGKSKARRGGGGGPSGIEDMRMAVMPGSQKLRRAHYKRRRLSERLEKLLELIIARYLSNPEGEGGGGQAPQL